MSKWKELDTSEKIAEELGKGWVTSGAGVEAGHIGKKGTSLSVVRHIHGWFVAVTNHMRTISAAAPDPKAAVWALAKKLAGAARTAMSGLREIGFEVDSSLVATTGHVSKDDAEMLEACARGEDSRFLMECADRKPLIVHELGEYGFLVWCGQNGERDFTGWSPGLQCLHDLAVVLNCAYIRLDRDGPVVPTVPKYEW